MKRFPFPLRFTIPCLLFLLGGLSSAWSFQQQVSSSNRQVEERLTWQAQFMGFRTTGLLEYILRSLETIDAASEGTNIIISQLAGDPNLRLATIIDDTNQITQSTQGLLRTRSVTKTPIAAQLPLLTKVRQTLKGEIILSDEKDTLWAVYPFFLGNKPGELRPSRVGILLLQYDLSNQKQLAYNDALERSLQNTAILAGLCILIWFLFEQILTRRAAQLVVASDRLAKGELDARIKLNGSDELAQIANAFDEMADRIQHNTEALQFSETQLRQQTQQLEQTLVKLQKTQAQLIQTEKMSGLGQLVSGVAHEINNPVNFIHGNLTHSKKYVQDLLHLIDLYQHHYPNPAPEIKAELEDIELDFLIEDFSKIHNSMRSGTERIRNIVLSLRNFSRLDEADMKPVDIHDGIESTLLILQNRLKVKPNRSEIQVIKDYGQLPLVNCYAGQLNQVFMNILTNAIDVLEESIPRSQQPTPESIADGLERIDYSPKIYIQTQKLNENRIVIKIADNGKGIPQEIKERIFDPFFTTKCVGKGTGLGLSISYQIVVDRHGGKLRCKSTPREGTEFRIEIPISNINSANLCQK